MSHRAKIVWVPAFQVHQIVCLDCAEVLCKDVEGFAEFEFPGDCKPPSNVLGVHVSDDILVRSFFGGKPVQ